MITILQVTPAYKPAYVYGGPTLSVSGLCEVLHKIHMNIKVLTTTANGKEELNIETNKLTRVAQVEVYYFKRLTKDHTHFSPALFLKLISLIKADKKVNPGQLVIHIHSWWNTIAIISCLIGRWYRIPVVLSPRGMITTYSLHNRNAYFKYLIHQLLGKPLLKYCYIHATTEKEKQDIQGITKKINGIHVIPNFIKYPALIQAVKSAINFPQMPIKLLFLSRIEEKKGLDILISSLSSLRLNWQLTIAGHGETNYVQQLKELCRDLNIHHQISWIGAVNNIKKFKVLRNNDLFILPSHNENFGNVVIESLSVGTPVIISRQVGLAAYVEKHNLGWITELEPKDLATIITQAASDYKKRGWIRKEAPKIIRKDYKEKSLVIKYTYMYDQILKHVN